MVCSVCSQLNGAWLMTATAPALVRSWAVGRYTATLTVPPLASGVIHAVIEWEPHIPNDLTSEELGAYHRGLNAAIQELGLSALVVN